MKLSKFDLRKRISIKGNIYEDDYSELLHIINSMSGNIQDNINTEIGNLGILAYDDLVEKARLGTTIIDGGYIRTELLTADNIVAGTLNAGVVSVTNLDAGNIATGELDADFIDVDDLFAENITLTGDIQSDNFSSGVTGWKIDGATDSVEFNDGTITGATIQTGTDGKRVVIDNSVITFWDNSDNSMSLYGEDDLIYTTSSFFCEAALVKGIRIGESLDGDSCPITITKTSADSTIMEFTNLHATKTAVDLLIPGYININSLEIGGTEIINSDKELITCDYKGNSISTTYTAAKCTDASADQTSSHTADDASNYTGNPIDEQYIDSDIARDDELVTTSESTSAPSGGKNSDVHYDTLKEDIYMKIAGTWRMIQL